MTRPDRIDIVLLHQPQIGQRILLRDRRPMIRVTVMPVDAL